MSRPETERNRQHLPKIEKSITRKTLVGGLAVLMGTAISTTGIVLTINGAEGITHEVMTIGGALIALVGGSLAALKLNTTIVPKNPSNIEHFGPPEE